MSAVLTRKRKKQLLDKLDELDKKAKLSQLNDDKLNLKHTLNERLAQLLREEEIKWYQRTKVKNLLEEDANTKGLFGTAYAGFGFIYFAQIEAL